MKDRENWPLACFIYFVLYVSLFVVWRKIHPGGVLFYQGLSLALAVSLLQIVIKKQSRETTGAIKDALITFLLCFCFMFTIPTTVDRSYTIRMIMEIQSHQNGLSRYQIEQYFSEDFIEHGGIEKRLAEQTATGSLVEREGRYHLTLFGQFLGNSFSWVQQLFSIRSNQPPSD
ncbi:hypothetical protein ACFL1S_05730 [Pseudomonadota bacterium]